MFSAKTQIARDIKVLVNSSRQGDQWAQIKDATTGEILHTGRVGYIQQVAKKRYNKEVKVNR